MGVQVGIRPLGDASVVSLSGVGDAALLARVAGAVVDCTPADRLLVVEIDDLLVSSLDTLQALVGTVKGSGRRAAFCCGRVSGRRLLRRCGGDEVAVFATVEEAAPALLAAAV